MAVGVKPRSDGSSPNGLTTGRAVAVLAVVVGCLVILWPKIFYPMLIVALRGTDGSDTDYPPPMVPGGPMAARLQQSGKRVPPPHARLAAPGPQGPSKGASKSSTFNIIMPIYTLGIIILFVYMIFKIMSRSDKEKVDLNRLAYNERSQLAQQAMAARRGGLEVAKGQNNNFEPPKRNRKDPRNAFENNTKIVLKMYGKDKMLDALNVVVNEMHEYKKQAIELTKQLEEQKKTTSGENKVDDIDEREGVLTAELEDDVEISDKEEAGGEEAVEHSEAESNEANEYVRGDATSQNDNLEADDEDDEEVDVERQEEEEYAPSEAPSEQDSDESEREIENQSGEQNYEQEGKNDEDASQSIDDVDDGGDIYDGEEYGKNYDDDNDDDGGREERVKQPQHTTNTARNVDAVKEEYVVDDGDADEAGHVAESGEENRNQQQKQHDREDRDVTAGKETVHNVEGIEQVSKSFSDDRLYQADQEDENDAEVKEVFCQETPPDKKKQKKKKVTVNKSVYVKHPECLCGTPPPDDDDDERLASGRQKVVYQNEAERHHPPYPSANTIDEIYRNQERFQFLDHATEIEPGAKLQCFDDVIYGQFVTERTPEENSSDGSLLQNNLQILQELITKGRGNDFGEIGQEPSPSDYQQWKSITPEDLFKTATTVVERTDERNATCERNSRQNYRNDDRVNGNYQNNPSSGGSMKSRLPSQNFYYEESAPSGGFEESGKLRRRTRRARRAD